MTVKLRCKQPNAGKRPHRLPVTDTGLRFENAPSDFGSRRYRGIRDVAARFAIRGGASFEMVQQIAEASAGGQPIARNSYRSSLRRRLARR